MLSKKVKYLGMMGSANKVRSVKEQLAMEDQKTDDFNKKVHAPIGLSIKSITPAEIAVSIAAEMIAVKNG
jgi:xanthine dehydrogenase accessory factor